MGKTSEEPQATEEQRDSFWGNLQNQWKVFISALCKPLLLFSLVFTCGALYFANGTGVDKTLSLILNIIAAVFAGFAGGMIYDSIKESTGNTILIKKGQSAVRNLLLARMKTKNISARAAINATMPELINLLELLEKDINNSVQEWNDIIPGVRKIEAIYASLEEKEQMLQNEMQEKEKLKQTLAEEKKLNDEQKQAINKKVEQKEETIQELNRKVISLKAESTAVSSAAISGVSMYDMDPDKLTRYFTAKSGNPTFFGGGRSGRILGGTAAVNPICKKCGQKIVINEAGEFKCEKCG